MTPVTKPIRLGPPQDSTCDPTTKCSPVYTTGRKSGTVEDYAMRTSAYTSVSLPDESLNPYRSDGHQAVAESGALAYLELDRTQRTSKGARDEFLSTESLDHVRIHTGAAQRALHA